MGIIKFAGLRAQVLIIKKTQRHKYNTKIVQIFKDKTLKRQTKNNMMRKSSLRKYCEKSPKP
jgi:hypothetical protein